MSDSVARLNAALEGRYTIERELGEGGMATVYLADDLKHDRKVALKVLKPELAAVVGAERFLAEIQVTANLTHPHILPLFDSGEADGFLFYVMPYLEGETLRDRIDRQKQLPVDEAVALASKVAGALQHAHEHGVIHRDIKPGNILLQDGEPVVADFGIALALGVAGGTRLTETGLSVGTPFYMSPEQATGDQAVGASTDTYALGSVLYEMLVGDPPYPGSTAQAVLGKIIAGKPVSATEQRPSVPVNVDAAIRKALEKLPADRFVSAQDFVRALGDEHFRYRELATVGGDVGVGPWNRLSIGLAGLATVLTLTLGWSLLRPEPPQPVSRQVLSTEGWAGLEGPPFGQYAALAPDGSSMILPVGSSASDLQLALKMRGSTEINPIPGTEGGRNVSYSPDGQWIAYAVGSDLFKRPLLGGSSVRLAEDVQAPPAAVGLAWLDDGTILYEQVPLTVEPGLAPRGLVQIPEDGGEPLVVFWPESGAGTPTWVHGLPDARGALAVTCAGPCPNAELHVVDLRDPSSELILEQVKRAWYTPTGHLVYVQEDGAVFAAPFDLDALEITGSAIPLFDGVRGGRNWADMQLAADGTLLYVEGTASAAVELQQLLVVDLEGDEEALVAEFGGSTDVVPLTPRLFGAPRWSPDGRSVAYYSGEVPDLNIFTYDLELGTIPRQLTFQGRNIDPVWSPDGTRIGFSSIREGSDGWDLYAKTLTSDAPETQVLTYPGNQYMRSWPEPDLVLFESGEGGRSELWTFAPSGGGEAAPYLATDADLDDGVLSRDGRWVAYQSNETGVEEVYVRSFPDPGQQIRVTDGGGQFPRWTQDGTAIYYWGAENLAVDRLFAASFTTEPTFTVLARELVLEGDYIPEFWDLHPEGARVLAVQSESAFGAGQPQRFIMVTNFFEELRQRMGN